MRIKPLILCFLLRLLVFLGMLAIGVGYTSPAAQGATIIVGDHELMPNTPNQTVAIHAVGGDLVSGIDLFVQVGDGGPELSLVGLPSGTDGPAIRGVELIQETIFEGVSDVAIDIGSPLLDQVALYTLALVGPTRQVPADGVLAHITIDTTGHYAGSWPISVSGVLPFESLSGPYTTNFADQEADFIRNGSINITTAPLQAGDGNQDLTFQQHDIVQVLQAGKYLTGESATWGEGDWNGAPGGGPGNPPPGNGLFDQADIVAALQSGAYRTGPYAALRPDRENDEQRVSIVYDATTGYASVNTLGSTDQTSISVGLPAKAVADGPLSCRGLVDCDWDDTVFKVAFDGAFGPITFVNRAQYGLGDDVIMNDLTVVGSIAAGRGFGNVDFIYVPEPTSALLLAVGIGLVCLKHFGSCVGQPILDIRCGWCRRRLKQPGRGMRIGCSARILLSTSAPQLASARHADAN